MLKTIERIALERVRKSPFRRFALNPLRPEKLSYLKKRIEKEGLLPIITLRPVKDHYESAVGHHRIQCCIDLGITEAQFLIEELSDAEMLDRLLDDSNSEMDDMRVCTEACYNVVHGAAKRLLTLPRIAVTSNYIRYAPSFSRWESTYAQEARPVPYTASMVATFLGQTMPTSGTPKNNVRAALQILELMELGKIKQSEFKDIKCGANLWYKFCRKHFQSLETEVDPLLAAADCPLV